MNETQQLVEQTMHELGFDPLGPSPLHCVVRKAIRAVLVYQRPTYSTSGGTVRNKTQKQRELEFREVEVLCGILADCFREIAPTWFGVWQTIDERMDIARRYINDLRTIA